MAKLLSNFDEYERNTGFTETDFYNKFILPIEKIKKAISKKKEVINHDFKWAVWERDNFTCKHCGSRKNLSIDHIIPESKGGKLTMENCQTLCCKCNSKKGMK